MRIVVSNPDTLGDFVLRQPLFSALHDAGHELLLIVRPSTVPLVKFVAPYAQTATLPVDPYKMDVEAHWQLFKQLEKVINAFKPDVFVIATYQWTDFEEAIARRMPAVRLAGMSGRNTGYPRRDALLTPEGRQFDLFAQVEEGLPELEKNESLARAILNNAIVLPDPRLLLTPEAKASAISELSKMGLGGGDYCAVCVTGTANVSLKAWPIDRWADVLSSWMQTHGTRILFTAPKSEAPAVEATRALMGRSRARTFQWIDETGEQLETLIGLLGLSNGYIGHDTGPMHMAAALGKPVMAVFGGGHWPRFLPAAPASRVLTASVPCIGCGWNCPFEKPYCVQALQAPDVLAALNDLTESAELRRETLAQPLSSNDARAMLEESAAIAARERRELTRQLSLVSQRESELGVLKHMVRETAEAAESNRLAAVERLAMMESLDVELKRTRSEGETLQTEVSTLHTELGNLQSELVSRKAAIEASQSRIVTLDANIAALNANVSGLNLELAGKDVEIACLKEKVTGDERKIREQSDAYGALMRDRNAWVEIYKQAEAKLKKNDELYWYERIWDTAKRIGKFAVYGRQYVRRPGTTPLPSISIVTPVFNCVDYIRDTIESVLNQNYPRLEYIIVDGGSTDGTLKIINEYRGRINRVISEPDAGLYDAVGKGFDNSGGEIFAYLNADDMFEPGALLRVGEYFRDHPRAGIIYHENTVSANGWRFPNIAQPHVDVFSVLNGHTLFQDGVFFRREKYFAAGGVNRSLRGAGDWALWLEMALWFRFKRVRGHRSAFRVRPGQISGNMDAYNLERDAVRLEFNKRFSAKRLLRRLPRRLGTSLKNLTERLTQKRSFFYPVDFPNMPPPPGKEPPLNIPPPVCPITGQPPDRLILSARHPMLGPLEINHIYFKDDTRVAVNHPAPNEEQAKTLRAQRFAVPPVDWSKPPDGCAGPKAPYASPYANAPMKGNALERMLRKAWCAHVRPNPQFPNPAAAIHAAAMSDVAAIFPVNGSHIRFLDASSLDGGLLDAVAAQTQWRRAGVEPNPEMAAAARAKGHRILECSIDDAPFAFSLDERFEIIHVGQSLTTLPKPLRTLNALQNMLAPGGVIVIGSPNLDSKQQEWFGPAWSHWHLTRFHALYSRRSLERLADVVNMRIERASSFSHAEWTAFSMHFQVHGLAWSTPHINNIPESALNHAGRLERLLRTFWDFRGRGDYISAVLRRKD